MRRIGEETSVAFANVKGDIGEICSINEKLLIFMISHSHEPPSPLHEAIEHE